MAISYTTSCATSCATETPSLSPSYTNKTRKVIFDRINSLSSTEHEEIFKIIRQYNVIYSQNKNGIFFNLSNLSDDVVKNIDEFVSYCMSNKKDLDEYDKILNECKINNNINTLPAIKTSLDQMGKLHIAHEQNMTKPSWKSAQIDEISMERLMKFVDRMTHDKEKIGKKKMNLKYNNAKKKYSKKNSDKKIDSDITDILQYEQYLL
jgi:hypothetical protein